MRYLSPPQRITSFLSFSEICAAAGAEGRGWWRAAGGGAGEPANVIRAGKGKPPSGDRGCEPPVPPPHRHSARPAIKRV